MTMEIIIFCIIWFFSAVLIIISIKYDIEELFIFSSIILAFSVIVFGFLGIESSKTFDKSKEKRYHSRVLEQKEKGLCDFKSKGKSK